MEKSLTDYIENCGLPETDEHEALAGEALDKYLEETGLTFEDVRTIIEEWAEKQVKGFSLCNQRFLQEVSLCER